MTKAPLSRIVPTESGGQVVIPTEMREALGIAGASLLKMTLLGDQIVVTRLVVLPDQAVRIFSDDEIQEFLTEDGHPVDASV